MKKFLFFAVFALLVLSLQNVKATVHVVSVTNFSFTPANVTVNPGDTVRWVLSVGLHTTTSDPSSPKMWDSGTLGAPFNLQFVLADGPGPFTYHCATHPLTMMGTINQNIPPPPPPTIFPFLLDESGENLCSGTGSTATGYGLAILSSDSTKLSMYVVHNVSGANAAHIHKAAPCVNGGIVFPFSSFTSPISQVWSLTPGDVADLFAGNLYVNIHSGSFPGGEIRGQIVQEPIRFLFAMSEAQETPPNGSFASGCAELVLSADGKQLSIHIDHDVRNTVSGHIHLAPPGSPGSIQFPFANANAPINETWNIDTTSIKNLFNGQLYANIHSMAFSGGEIRGQCVRDSLTWLALMDGAQANGGAGTGSTARGFGVLVLSADQKHLRYHIEHGVVSPTNGHIHYGPAGVEGPVAHGFSSFTSPIDETWDLTSADVDSLLAGHLYINIHSAAFPLGEIRGQIKEQQVQYTFVLDQSQENLCAGTGSPAVGSAQATLKPCGKELTIDATHNVPMPTGAHIHLAPVCVNGGIVYPFASATSPIKGIWYLGSPDIIDFLQHDLYMNVHSTPFPAGEIRGQLVTCCQGNRGDVNFDGTNTNILDLTYMVDFIFRGGPRPRCPEEADCNSDGTGGNILDLTFLVDRIFRGGPPAGPCPA